MLTHVWSYAGRIVELRVSELTDDDAADLAELAAVAQQLGLRAFEQQTRLWRIGPCEGRKLIRGFPGYLFSISEANALHSGIHLVERWISGSLPEVMQEMLPPVPRPYHISRGRITRHR